jgi:NADH dehydrogenase
MRIAITGGTGFIGSHLARALVELGHEAVLIARGSHHGYHAIRGLSGTRLALVGTRDQQLLTDCFAGCQAVAHCAGINREIGAQSFQVVHVDGTRRVVEAARRAGAEKILLISFLRARPDCGSGYHESKWAAEGIVRTSGLSYTVLKPGVVYGQGDHMLDHLSHAFFTFPVFPLLGMRDRPIRPLAVEDLVRVALAALVENRLPRQTVAVVGPEELSLSAAVKRVSRAVGKRPLFIRLPVRLHLVGAWLFERTMRIPLVSLAQVRILSEGIVEPWGQVDALPPELRPRLAFTDQQIRQGLPEPGRFGLADLRCWRRAVLGLPLGHA